MTTLTSFIATGTCAVVPRKNHNDPAANDTMISPQLMSGRGKTGGKMIVYFSDWYCWKKGIE